MELEGKGEGRRGKERGSGGEEGIEGGRRREGAPIEMMPP